MMPCDMCGNCEYGGYCEKCEKYLCLSCVPTGHCCKCNKSYCINCDPCMMPCEKCHEMNCIECSPGGYCENCKRYLCFSCDPVAPCDICKKMRCMSCAPFTTCKTQGCVSVTCISCDLPAMLTGICRECRPQERPRSTICQKDKGTSVKKCNVCSKPCSLECSGCHSVFYCDSRCQYEGWKSHKKACLDHQKKGEVKGEK